MYATGKESMPTNVLTVTIEQTYVKVALGKPASSSSQEVEGTKSNTADKANDGELDTRWCASGEEVPQWWKVDLQGEYDISRTRVTWEEAPEWFNGEQIYQYYIEVSSDDENWTRIVDRTNNTSSARVQTHDFEEVSARYVRITITGLPERIWASFCEFEVFTEIKAPAAPTNLISTGVGTTSVSLEWEPVEHIVPVSGYNIYAGNTLVATAPGNRTSYTVTGLRAASTYTCTVTATDDWNNEAVASNSETVSTP